MSTQQWEIGKGRVWTFEATAIVTSGDIVKFVGDKVRVTEVSGDRPAGVVLFPASAGKLAAVALDMIVYVNITGSVAPSAGAYLISATQGKGRCTPLTAIGQVENVVGRAIETATINTRAKVKLIW